jgi:hypothetical protein
MIRRGGVRIRSIPDMASRRQRSSKDLFIISLGKALVGIGINKGDVDYCTSRVFISI